MISAQTLRFAALCSIAFLAQHVQAQGKDELWEMTTKMDMPGMPVAMPAQTNRVCMEAGNNERAVPKGDESCRVTDVKKSGDKMTYKMECSGREKMTGEGEMTRSGDRISGTMHLKGARMNMTQTYSGRKVGSCDAATYRKQQQAQASAKFEKPMEESRAKGCASRLEALDADMFKPIPVGPNASAKEKAQAQKMLGCDDYKPKFCAKVSEVAKEMAEPKGYLAARSRYHNLDGALRQCGQDPKKMAAAVCQNGVQKRDWSFVVEQCPAEAKAAAARNCVGRDYTEVMEKAKPEYRDLCLRAAPQRGLKGRGGKGDDEDTGDRPAANRAAKESGEDSGSGSAVDEGKKALRNFLKF